ncbi:MAG: prolyl oligopeptidase family serine peptidase [Erythrobacter sp.]
MIRALPLALAASLISVPSYAEAPQLPQYPETRADPIVEEIFGEQVADPYRWLEEDVRNSEEVAGWVESQNTVTEGFLDGLSGNDWFRGKIGGLLNFERFGIPRKAGENYFYSRNSGLQNQSQLFVQEGLDGTRRLLIDPNAWAKDGATALAGWVPSEDGTKLAYSVQDGGTDWRIIRILDVATGEVESEEVRWAKFTGISWIGNEGFLYSRFPEPEEGQDFQELNFNQQVYFHRVGTAQSEDELVFATPDHPKRGHSASTTDDGRWMVITSSLGTDSKYEVHLIDLAKRDADGWKPIPLVTGFKNEWSLIDSVDGKLYFTTNESAPKFRIVTIDMDGKKPEWTTIIPEVDEPISGASIVGKRLVVEYLKDAASNALLFDLAGKPVGQIEMAGLGSAGGFGGKASDPETFYSYTSFNRPSSIYRLNLETGKTDVFATPELTFDPDDYAVEQKFYASKDGTKIPMFIVRKKSIAAANAAVPTLLYGYGGFDISLTPSFSATRMAWLEAGGAFALANIRGGGEYGKDWHDGGRRENKQNSFDDFIAAGEYLKAEGITTPDGLAIQGGSNGGLLVGAVVNQRPDLVNAAHAAVGVMDMLRFDRWTAGRYWVDDYGYPDREKDWKLLRSYSPYHNIKSGTDYPAVLVTTADTDDRVVPAHSFKYAAALQAAELGDKPQIIRIETRAGHGSGKPTDKAIEEGADVLSFLAQYTGLDLPEEAVSTE